MHTKRRPNNGMNGGGNGQHRHHNNHNNNRPRRFNNTGSRTDGPDSAANVARTRRGAVQNRDKYQMMARDAMSMGDRVLAENYLQHADHYHRVLLELPPEEAPRPQYLRGHGPQDQQNPNGEQQNHQGNDQQAGDNQHGSHEQPHMRDEREQVQQPSPHALPSFITQTPVNPDAPGSHEE